jgi:hypothetical protein
MIEREQAKPRRKEGRQCERAEREDEKTMN